MAPVTHPTLCACPLLCDFAVPSCHGLPLDTGLSLGTCSDQRRETSELEYSHLLSFVLLTLVRGGHVQAVLLEDDRQQRLE